MTTPYRSSSPRQGTDTERDGNEVRKTPSFKEVLNFFGNLSGAQLDTLASALAEPDGFDVSYTRVRRLSEELRLDPERVGPMLQVLGVVEQRLFASGIESAAELPIAIQSLADLVDRSETNLSREVYGNIERLLVRNSALDLRKAREAVRQGFGDEAVGFRGMLELRPLFGSTDDLVEFVMVSTLQITLRSTNPNTSNVVVQLDTTAMQLLQSCLDDLKAQMNAISSVPHVRIVR